MPRVQRDGVLQPLLLRPGTGKQAERVRQEIQGIRQGESMRSGAFPVKHRKVSTAGDDVPRTEVAVSEHAWDPGHFADHRGVS